MTHQIVVGYSSDSSEFVEIDDDINSSRVGSNNFLGLSESLHSVALSRAGSIHTAYCQYKDEDSLVECLTYRSYFELDTFCHGC
jgi:hypothetical protein